jgi:hypothetical protein
MSEQEREQAHRDLLRIIRNLRWDIEEKLERTRRWRWTSYILTALLVVMTIFVTVECRASELPPGFVLDEYGYPVGSTIVSIPAETEDFAMHCLAISMILIYNADAIGLSAEQVAAEEQSVRYWTTFLGMLPEGDPKIAPLTTIINTINSGIKSGRVSPLSFRAAYLECAEVEYAH